jgi:hypothetical protein
MDCFALALNLTFLLLAYQPKRDGNLSRQRSLRLIIGLAPSRGVWAAVFSNFPWGQGTSYSFHNVNELIQYPYHKLTLRTHARHVVNPMANPWPGSGSVISDYFCSEQIGEENFVLCGWYASCGQYSRQLLHIKSLFPYTHCFYYRFVIVSPMEPLARGRLVGVQFPPWKLICFLLSGPALGFTLPSILWVTVSLPAGQRRPEREAHHSPPATA